MADLNDWVGRFETVTDVITASACARMAATLDRDAFDANSTVPAPWHWLGFLPDVRQAQLSDDGHPKRGGFLPPIDLPRRMWAAGSLRFHASIPVDVSLQRQSEIVSISEKNGRSGRLVFVRVHHRISVAGDVPLLDEDQDIVYREAAPPLAPDASAAVAPPASGERAPDNADWRREIRPDPTLLFRFSALTFNAHRIHYDRPYAREVEGYPGLVVHGPLLATLLLDAARHEGGLSQPRSFEFRALRPVFDGDAFSVCGRREESGKYSLWIADAQGMLCMRATAT